MGPCVGQEGQHLIQQPAELLPKPGEIQALRVQVELVDKLVIAGLEVGQVPAQIEHKGLDALHEFRQHIGKNGGDHRDEGQVGGEHRQRAGGPPGPRVPQTPQIEPVEEAAGPVEHKGDGKADEQRLEHAQHPHHRMADHVQTGQHHHQHHRVGDDEQDTFQQFFVHSSSWFP